MKRIIVLIALVSMIFIGVPATTFAQDPFGSICDGPRQDSSVCQSENTLGNPLFGPEGVLTQVIQILVILGGVASVIMIMVGGFKYIVSNGDPGKVNSAKDTILYSVIGLAVTVLSQTIVTFVLMRL